MATFFEKVPREIRDQIYRELLLDDVHHIKPQEDHSDDTLQRKRLAPVVLRLCRQAYAEASIVLYEENIFRYQWGHSQHDTWTPRKHAWPRSNCLERIKHIEIINCAETPRWRQDTAGSYWYYYESSSIRALKRIINWFRSLDCSLRTLRLAFIFQDSGICMSNGYFVEETEDIAVWIASDNHILKAFTLFRVLDSIEVTVNSMYEGDCRTFATFASNLGGQKGWAVSNVRKETASSSDGSSGDKSDDEQKFNQLEKTTGDGIEDIAGFSGGPHLRDNGPIRHIWTWLLTPKNMASEDENSDVKVGRTSKRFESWLSADF